MVPGRVCDVVSSHRDVGIPVWALVLMHQTKGVANLMSQHTLQLQYEYTYLIAHPVGGREWTNMNEFVSVGTFMPTRNSRFDLFGNQLPTNCQREINEAWY